MLPQVRSSSEVYGETDPALLGAAIPIAGDAGDQQAATFGQGCLEPGEAKVTLGTGAFLLANTGTRIVESANGLLSTVAWRLGPDAPIVYALEGSVFVTGAAVQWLRDGLGLVASAADVDDLASRAGDSGGSWSCPPSSGSGRRTDLDAAARSSV
jgi:glycerol kinase